MELHQWLDQPENTGKAAWLAAQLGLTKGAVSIWRTEGVPMKHMGRVAELSDGAVSVDDMLRHAMACKTAKAAA